MDLKLDPTTWDLSYTADGELEVVTGYDEAIQRLKVALETGLGEWSFDTDAGVAYRGIIRSKSVPLSAKEAEIRRVVYSVLGSGSVLSLTLEIDPVTRDAVGTVETVYGPVEIG